MKTAILFLALTVLGLVLVGQVWLATAQEAAPPVQTVTADQVNAIAKQLYCPVCENIPLDVCPTKACAEWRELIRELLAEGKTEREIKDYFVAQYGDRVLAIPPARGINWLVYVIPPAAILAGIYILYRGFKAWSRPVEQPPAQPAAAADADEYVARLEEELRKR